MHEMQTRPIVTDFAVSVRKSVSLSVTRLSCVWCICAAFAKLLWPLVDIYKQWRRAVVYSSPAANATTLMSNGLFFRFIVMFLSL